MEVKSYIYASWCLYEKKFDYRIRNYTVSNEVLVAEVMVPFESPTETQLRSDMAGLLRAKRQEVLADAQVEANKIDEQIQQMLALEDKS